MKRPAKPKPKKKRPAGSHGAVTVFLTIVLVPCIVFTSVFADLSRVELSRAVAASAGDLALYSLLAHYDEPLKEYYGLVASCQTIEEFYDVTEEYFVGMMQTEGVPEAGSQMFTEFLREMQAGDYSNLLQVAINEIEVTDAPNASLGENPALLEDGIVEFMKYRGPATIVEDVINRFFSGSSGTNIQKTLEEAEKNEEITDAKQEYAREQGELLDIAFNIYLAIRAYEQAQGENGPTTSSYSTLDGQLDDMRDDLNAVTALITEYYFPGSESLSALNLRDLDIDSFTAEKEDVGTATDQDGTTIYTIDTETYQDFLDDADELTENIQDSIDGFIARSESIPAWGSGVNEVVYCLNMQRAINDSGIARLFGEGGDGDDLLQLYADMGAAAECEPDPESTDLPADWKDVLQQKRDEIKTFYDENLAAGGTAAFRQKLTEYETRAASVAPKVQSYSYTFTSALCGGNVTVPEFCARASQVLNAAATLLTDRIAELDVVLEGGSITYNGQSRQVKTLDELATAAREFTNARNDWGAAANRYDTEFALEEQNLYAGASSVDPDRNMADNDELMGEKIAAQITEENVNQLKTRLTNIRNDMQDCLDAINGLTYGGRPLRELSSMNAMLQAAYQVIPETQSYQFSDAQNAARGYADQLIVPAEGDVYALPSVNGNADGNNPALGVATPVLYRFLKEQLNGREQDVDAAKTANDEQNEAYTEQGNEAKDNALSVGEMSHKGKNLTSVHGGAVMDGGTAIGSLLGLVDDLTSGNADEIRDKLYVCEYIMNMFTYASFDNEGRYNYQVKEEGSTPTYSAGAYSFSSTADTAWFDTSVTEVYENQSLTNRPLNESYNHANLGEIEFLLYGNPEIDANLSSMFKSLFAIREALNLVSGFCLFYSGVDGMAGVIGGIASAVAAATAGIVPVPVTKCVLIAAIATLETSSDLQRLKAGGPVELYKSSESQWMYGLSASDGATGGSMELAGKQPSGEGLYYSDYLHLFVLLAVLNNDTYSPILLRVGDLIQANMRLNGGGEDFSLGLSRSYFQLNANLRVEPLVITLPLVVNTVPEAGTLQQNTDWCTYNVSVVRGYS